MIKIDQVAICITSTVRLVEWAMAHLANPERNPMLAYILEFEFDSLKLNLMFIIL